jgi:hypothetical protein
MLDFRARSGNNSVMPTVTPPVVPPTASDESPLRRVHFRLWQIMLTTVTIIVTCWFFTLHVAAGLIAVIFAKHILVAILAVGLDVAPPKKDPPQAAS